MRAAEFSEREFAGVRLPARRPANARQLADLLSKESHDAGGNVSRRSHAGNEPATPAGRKPGFRGDKPPQNGDNESP